MATNLQIENAVNGTARPVKDQRCANSVGNFWERATLRWNVASLPLVML